MKKLMLYFQILLANYNPNNWSKWECLHIYTFLNRSFLIQGRINTVTGFVKFKTTRIGFGFELCQSKRLDFSTLFDNLIRVNNGTNQTTETSN